MREHKYRSYNSFLKKFFYFSNGRYYDDTGKCISERVCSEFNWSNAEQYFNKKGKNCVDIYVGDIILSETNNNQSVKCIVGYCEEEARFSLTEIGGNKHSFFPFGFSGNSGAIWRPSSQEIIGNIHENRELC